MLVLTRKIDEAIVVDGPATITVNKVQGNRVTIGVTAPDSTNVKRGELVAPPVGQQPSDNLGTPTIA